MSEAWNIYCDESCHLENDGESHMVLGALACPTARVSDIGRSLRTLKETRGFPPERELKWTKVSPAGLPMYRDYLNFFLLDPELQFRAVVIQKDMIDHRKHRQTHDDFYYKMFFLLLAHLPLGDETERYIYVDIKDTRSEVKVRRLERILRLNLEGSDTLIQRVQHIRSHEVELAQLADLLIGAVGYANRRLTTSTAKRALVRQLKQRTNLSLTKTTAMMAPKVNLLVWKEAEGG